MKREYLKNLILTGYIKGKNDKGRQQTTYLMSLHEWITGSLTKGQTLLKATRDRRLRKVMITHVLKGHYIEESKQVIRLVFLLERHFFLYSLSPLLLFFPLTEFFFLQLKINIQLKTCTYKHICYGEFKICCFY